MEFYNPISDNEAKNLSSELPFFSAHNHTEISNYRLRDSIIRINELIDNAIELGYNGVCCTDHEALSAHVKLIKHYKELKEKDKLPEGFKIGLGNEIYLIDSMDDVTTNYVSGQTKYYHFLLLAKDKKGYEQIKQISSESAWSHWFRQGMMERVPTIKSELEEIIGDEKGHIIASTACLGGELDNLILDYLETNDIFYKKKIHNFINWCIKVFGKENFFLEIQPCIIKKDENGEKIPHKQAIVNQFMFNLSKGYGLKIICTTDSHYASKKDRLIHEAYLKADDEDKKQNREVAEFYETAYMFEKNELIKNLSEYLTVEQIKEVFNNTKCLYDKIEEFDLYHPTIVPTDKKIPPFKLRHTLRKWYDKYEYIKKYAESDNIQDQYLLYLVEVGMDKLDQWGDSEFHFATYDYDGSIIEEHDKIITQEEKIKRINEEFSSFWQISEKLNQKLSAYYVLVRGLIHEVMWKVSFVGIARGSCGGSYICYLSEITQINPLKFDLPFWRHSSPLRPELPD